MLWRFYCLVIFSLTAVMPATAQVIAAPVIPCRSVTLNDAPEISPDGTFSAGGIRYRLTNLYYGEVEAAPLPPALFKTPLLLYAASPRGDKDGVCPVDVYQQNGETKTGKPKKGLWLQAELLRRGLAVYTDTPRPHRGRTALLEAEQQGRGGVLNNAGGWQSDVFTVIPAAKGMEHLNTWQIVSGTVQSIKPSGKNGWLLDIGGVTLRVKTKGGETLEDWQGKTVEARGYLYWSKGARLNILTAAHLLQISDVIPSQQNR